MSDKYDPTGLMKCIAMLCLYTYECVCEPICIYIIPVFVIINSLLFTIYFISHKLLSVIDCIACANLENLILEKKIDFADFSLYGVSYLNITGVNVTLFSGMKSN